MDSPITLSPCPSAHALVDLACGRVPRPAADELRRHLDQCEDCRVAVTRAVGPSSETRVALPVNAEVAARYRIVRLLGRGGMGEVHEAWDTNLERRVAIKVLLPRGNDRDDVERLIARLVRESKAMARLRHPNVVAVHDAGTWNGSAFVVMELVDGETLRAWLVRRHQEHPKPWQEIVAMFVGAGRGLAAAHAVGIVHRDFKPDNVLVDEHGRPQVTDFGLARLADEAVGWTAPEPAPMRVADERARIDSRLSMATMDASLVLDASGSLTETGAAVGTPAYMAPEQFRGQPVDARTDVFGFCVALFEGLAGVRPFVGEGPRGIVEAHGRGASEDPLRAVDVPRWIRAAVLDGLRADPRARPASMNALLQRLQRRPARAWIALAGVGIGAAALAVGATLAMRGEEDPCALGSEPWDDARRTRIAAAHADTPQVWARAERSFDRFASEWSSAWSQSCGVRRSVEHELRRTCLLGARQAFAAIVHGLEAGEIQLDGAIDGLPRLGQCGDTRDLVASDPLPDDEALAAEVAAIRSELAELESLLWAGQSTTIGARIDTAVARARATGFRPIEAEALHLLATSQSRAGDPRTARATMTEAATMASASGHDSEAALAWIGLVSLQASDLLDFERGAEAAALADAAMQRMGDSPDAEALRAQLSLQVGTLHWRTGRLDEAIAELEAARRLAERLDPELLDSVLEVVALVQDDLGRSAEAGKTHRELIERRIAMLGPDHPALAVSYGHLAGSLFRLGDLEGALHNAEEQMRVCVRAYGEDHPECAESASNRGMILNALGRWDEALADQQLAERLMLQAYGEDSPKVAHAMEQRADVLQSMQRYDEAVALMRHALEIDRRNQSWMDTARCRTNLADLLRESGHADDALALARESVAEYETRGHDMPEYAYAIAVLGEIELELGRPGNAAVVLERAVAMFEEGGYLPDEAALARFLLARALVASDGDVARARTLAESAVVRWNGGSAEWEPRLRKARTWLALLPPG